jgi:hypothetical protein
VTKLSGSGGGIQQIIHLIGPEQTMKLCQAHGGVRHYIPKKPRPDHKFAKLIGMEAWQVLCSDFGGTHVTFPKLHQLKTKRRHVLALLRNSSMSVRDIAMEVDVTERYVSRLSGELKRLKAKELPLFDAKKSQNPRAVPPSPSPRETDIRLSQQRRSAAMK